MSPGLLLLVNMCGSRAPFMLSRKPMLSCVALLTLLPRRSCVRCPSCLVSFGLIVCTRQCAREWSLSPCLKNRIQCANSHLDEEKETDTHSMTGLAKIPSTKYVQAPTGQGNKSSKTIKDKLATRNTRATFQESQHWGFRRALQHPLLSLAGALRCSLQRSLGTPPSASTRS